MKFLKFFFIVCLLFINKKMNSQNKSFEVEILCYKEKIKKDEKSNFVIKLINNSDTSFTIKKPLFIYNEESLCDIGYEIYYCRADDTSIARYKSFGQPFPIETTEIFSSAQPLIKEIPVEGTYFDKKGVYKIRFSFHLERMLGPAFSIVKSDWLFFEAN